MHANFQTNSRCADFLVDLVCNDPMVMQKLCKFATGNDFLHHFIVLLLQFLVLLSPYHHLVQYKELWWVVPK